MNEFRRRIASALVAAIRAGLTRGQVLTELCRTIEGIKATSGMAEAQVQALRRAEQAPLPEGSDGE